MFKPTNFRVDFGKLRNDARYRLCGSSTPIISWAVNSDCENSYQCAYKIKVISNGEILWETDFINSHAQQARYDGVPLPLGVKIIFEVTVKDNHGNISETGSDYFYSGQREDWGAQWISSSNTINRRPVYFRQTFENKKKIKNAVLYVCGIGYHKISINGIAADTSVMDPAWSDYTQSVHYVMLPELQNFFKDGENVMDIIVSDGWRNIDSAFLNMHTGTNGPRFNGIPQLSAILDMTYSDDTHEQIITDENWKWAYGAILESNIYDGEIYDASQKNEDYQDVSIVSAPGGKMILMTLEPIKNKEEYKTQAVFSPKKGIYVADFGQNIAGVVKIKLPENMKCGQKITISHMEFLDEDGTLYMPPLRQAKCTDTYIASGDGNDLDEWIPEFTYHGFRYAQIEGYGRELERKDISSIARYSDLAEDSFFSCGNPLVNQIHKNVVATEKSNIHSVLTDCPQRDERLGWMNDATVRFEETPYNFDIGRLFPKIIRDLLDVQQTNGDGAITCTAPFIVGGHPADPVCSSFLVAGLESLIHTGNTDIIAEAYDGYAAWEKCLLDRSDDYIVNYSYYGDWAAPAYACIGEDGANSLVTPGILMSTGYSYYNCVLLSKFADILGKTSDREKYIETANKIQKAYLEKWYDPASGKVADGSQASQAFTMWLGLIDESECFKAAKIIHDDLKANDYRITTGNLCTRYLMDMLSKYGYINDAWKIITREEYPSYGFMIQHEATTIWERFELKKNPGMNSHNHPMYGAVGYWFYAYLCGIIPTSAAYDTIDIHPYIPDALLSAHANIDTVKGDVSVKWVKRYGKGYLYVKIPFGCNARVFIGGEIHNVGSGSHTFDWKL